MPKLESDLFWYRSYASNRWSQYKMVAKLFLPVPALDSVCFVSGSNPTHPPASWIPVGVLGRSHLTSPPSSCVMLVHAAQKAGCSLRQGLCYDAFRWLHSAAPLAAAFGSTMPSPTKLSAIVNMDKMLLRTPEQISSLWQEVSVNIPMTQIQFQASELLLLQ